MYSSRITRLNPSAFIFLIDQSGSMEEKMKFGEQLMTKAEAVAMVTNMLIRELINRCRREEGVMDYFDIAAIGYCDQSSSMLIGTDNGFVKPSELAMADCRKQTLTRERIHPDGSHVLVTDTLKYWIEPKAVGKTPMKSALEKALLLAGRWCRKTANRTSYPPTIFNITDGEASDSDYETLINIAEQIKATGTEDGNILLINIHISSGTDSGRVIFPSDLGEVAHSKYSELLYEMSSTMPELYNEAIIGVKGPNARPTFKGMSLNTSISDLLAMMNIGSRSVNKIQ